MPLPSTIRENAKLIDNISSHFPSLWNNLRTGISILGSTPNCSTKSTLKRVHKPKGAVQIMTKANIMCLNIEKGEAFTQEVTISRSYKDDKAILKAAEKIINSDTVKAVHVVSAEVQETLSAEVQETLSERPDYANLDSPAKFQAIQGIIITRLKQHPDAICSYSGGSDSDIMIDLIERTRNYFNAACGHEALKPVKYVFFNTGLEMKATKDHVKATAEKYGVEIEECRPKINIVKAVREHGIPFISKYFSQALGDWQKKMFRWQ